MKFLYFGDRHNRITSPENRIDNFHETMELKDKEIIELGKKHNVSAFLQPGDFWETPNPPLDYASHIIKKWFNVDVFDILQKMTAKDKVEKEIELRKLMGRVLLGEITDISKLTKELNEFITEETLKDDTLEKLKGFAPMVGVAGNHELFGNNINTLPKTMIGFMEKLGLIKFATKDNPYIIETEDGLKIAITGTHYHLDIDSPEHLNDYVVEEKLGDYHIHIVHGLLSDKSMGKMIRHTIIDQIKHTKADLTITGHDHIGFPLTQVDGKYFVNTGAIPRLSNDLKEMNRKPKVLLIDITKEKGLQLKEVYLRTALEGNMVLNRQKINAKKQKDSKLEEFKKAVRDAGLKNTTDINEIIRDIAENKNLDMVIRDDVVNQVSDKIKTMDGSLEGILPEAYIDKIIIENFMSHQFTELDVSRGFNIFVGESRQGKSAVLRALDWVYESRPLGKALIRKGTEYAKVTLYLSNGYVISRYIEAKKAGKNGYYITDPSTGDTSFYNTKMLPEVQKILGFNMFKVDDKDLQFNLNFLRQGAGWFLIGEQFSAPTKAKIIGAIYGTQYADAVIRDIELEERRLNDRMKLTVESYKKTDASIKEYDYLKDLEMVISNIEALKKLNAELEDRKNKIEKTITEREQLVAGISECEKELEQLQDVSKASHLLSTTQKEMDRQGRITDVYSKFEEYTTYLKNSTYVANILSNVGEWNKLLEQTNELKDKQNSLEILLQKREELLTNIKDENEVIESTESILQAKAKLRSLMSDGERMQSINALLTTRETIVQSIKEQDTIIYQTRFVQEASQLLSKANKNVLKREELSVNIERAERIEKDKDELSKGIHGCNRIIQYTRHTEKAKEVVEQIKILADKKSKIGDVLSVREQKSKEIEELLQVVKFRTNELSMNVKKYQQVLEKAGKCPVCFGTIDKATVNRIVNRYS